MMETSKIVHEKSHSLTHSLTHTLEHVGQIHASPFTWWVRALNMCCWVRSMCVCSFPTFVLSCCLAGSMCPGVKMEHLLTLQCSVGPLSIAHTHYESSERLKVCCVYMDVSCMWPCVCVCVRACVFRVSLAYYSKWCKPLFQEVVELTWWTVITQDYCFSSHGRHVSLFTTHTVARESLRALRSSHFAALKCHQQRDSFIFFKWSTRPTPHFQRDRKIM